MNDYIALIVALLSFAGTLAGSYFANRKSTALINYRIDQLEKRVNELTDKIETLQETYYKNK